MRAVVLVGGFGTRLQPLTLDTPKQMLPIVGKPMIEHVVEHLSKHGITEVVLSLGFAPDVFQATYPDGYCNEVPIHYAIEPEPLDTAGAIRFAAESANITETFLVLNGDVLTDLDIKKLVDFHKETKAKASIHLIPVEDPSRYGVVPTDQSGRVTGFIEKPPPGKSPTNWINAGTYVLEPSVLKQIPIGQRVSVEKETFPALAAESQLFAFKSETYWIDTGTPATYVQAQMDLLEGGVRGNSHKGVDPTSLINGEVAESVIGADVVIEKGARIERSVILKGAKIEQGAVVSNSIIGFDSHIGQNAAIRSLSVIGHRVQVPNGTELNGMTMAES